MSGSELALMTFTHVLFASIIMMCMGKSRIGDDIEGMVIVGKIGILVSLVVILINLVMMI